MTGPYMRVSIYLDQWGGPMSGSVDIFREGGVTETISAGCEPDTKPVTFFRQLANEGMHAIHREDGLSRLWKV